MTDIKLPEFYLVFDVESVGFFGEAFAFGAVLLNAQNGSIVQKFLGWCSPDMARGTVEDRAWVESNIDLKSFHTHPLPCTADVRDAFWRLWLSWGAGKNGVMLAADVPFPVETRFLDACLYLDNYRRSYQSPYPLIDIASVRLAAGLDPTATVERLPEELPAHNPLKDSIQSARLLAEALKLQ